MKKTLCRQCNLTEVIKRASRGTRPTCQSCRDKNQLARRDRNYLSRVLGCARVHHNAQGARYAERASPRQATCRFCNQQFVTARKKNKHGSDVCEKCSDIAGETRRKQRIAAISANYHKNPERVKRRRLARTLELMGLSIEWYDAQPKQCGICGTRDPGSQSWCIDHNHKCCPYGARRGCRRCVRGLLCSACNSGIGHFKDNPQTLRAAAQWLEDHPLNEPEAKQGPAPCEAGLE